MADVWRSNPRKFCEMCKCWFADNKVSVDHHENGVRHKNAVRERIKEMGRKGAQKEVDQANLRNTLMHMELSALQSYKRDVKDTPSTAAQYNVHQNIEGLPLKPAPRSTIGEQFEVSVSAEAKLKEGAVTKPKVNTEPIISVRPEQHEVALPETDLVWAEALTDDGYSYFWHVESGETCWEAPEEGFISLAEQSAAAERQAAAAGGVGEPSMVVRYYSEERVGPTRCPADAKQQLEEAMREKVRLPPQLKIEARREAIRRRAAVAAPPPQVGGFTGSFASAYVAPTSASPAQQDEAVPLDENSAKAKLMQAVQRRQDELDRARPPPPTPPPPQTVEADVKEEGEERDPEEEEREAAIAEYEQQQAASSRKRANPFGEWSIVPASVRKLDDAGKTDEKPKERGRARDRKINEFLNEFAAEEPVVKSVEALYAAEPKIQFKEKVVAALPPPPRQTAAQPATFKKLAKVPKRRNLRTARDDD